MTGTKTAKTFVRVCGAVACVVAAVSGWDAEAGWRRRCCATPCCEPVCCEPVQYEPVCCETRMVVTACPTRCMTCYDDCGRRIDCGCGGTVVYSRTVAPAVTCCEVATTGSAGQAAIGGPTLAGRSDKAAGSALPVAARSVLSR